MDIEAAVTAKLSTWKPQHLALWTDLVEPSCPSDNAGGGPRA